MAVAVATPAAPSPTARLNSIFAPRRSFRVSCRHKPSPRAGARNSPARVPARFSRNPADAQASAGQTLQGTMRPIISPCSVSIVSWEGKRQTSPRENPRSGTRERYRRRRRRAGRNREEKKSGDEMPRPEVQAPPEIFYNESEARKYTTSSRIIEIQARISERALQLLALPDDGVPKLLLDIGCGSGLSGETLTEHGHHWIGYDISRSMLDVALERESEGDLLLADMGEGLGLRPGVIDGAISISAVQWLCNADKSSHDPRLRLKAFFGSLYRCLARGARAVLQFYADNVKQSEMIVTSAMRAGFAGGVVIDWPHSSKAKKSYLVLTCGAPSLHTSLPKGKGQDGEMCSDDDGDDDESNDDQTVGIYERNRPKKRQKANKNGKGKDWLLRKKEQMRRRGRDVPADTKYTGRKRKSYF